MLKVKGVREEGNKGETPGSAGTLGTGPGGMTENRQSHYHMHI
jgi:hypothetical protein